MQSADLKLKLILFNLKKTLPNILNIEQESLMPHVKYSGGMPACTGMT